MGILREVWELMARERGIRLVMVVGAVWLTTAFNIGFAAHHPYLPYGVYWAEVAVFSLVVGAATGAFALSLTVLCVFFFIVPPAFSFRLDSGPEVALLAEYTAVGALVWAAAAIWRRWRSRT
jgi:hypothetical protein